MGVWLGLLQIYGIELCFGLEVSEMGGKLVVVFDSIDQNVKIVVMCMEMCGRKVCFEV